MRDEINMYYVMILQELNIGGSLVTAAIEDVCGVKRSKLRDMYNRLGDLGMAKINCLFIFRTYFLL